MYKPETNEDLNKFFQQYEDCFNRLPCGICRLTNMPCPKVINYEPNKITSNHIGDPVDIKTTNHITSEAIDQRFIVVTDNENFNCYSWDSVKQVFENNEINNYIIKYYEGDKYKGGYTFKALEEKLGVK